MAGEYQILDENLRRQPTDAVISQIRARYPTEPEIDKILTRKMNRRREGKGYTGVTLERLVESSQRLISERLGAPAIVANARWLSGGASKLQMMFNLDWRGPEGGDVRTETLVLRTRRQVATCLDRSTKAGASTLASS